MCYNAFEDKALKVKAIQVPRPTSLLLQEMALDLAMRYRVYWARHIKCQQSILFFPNERRPGTWEMRFALWLPQLLAGRDPNQRRKEVHD